MVILYQTAAKSSRPARKPFGLGLGKIQTESLPVARYTDADYADYLAGRMISAAELERQAIEAAMLDRMERAPFDPYLGADFGGWFLGHDADADQH